MDNCQCDKAGFCEYYNKVMTSSPPNWQWCQGATPEERIKHKVSCQKAHIRASSIRYISTKRLVDDCKRHLIPKLAEMDISGIAGIPRSGFLPASICAVALNIPLYGLSPEIGVQKMYCVSENGGRRMEETSTFSGKILLLDDTYGTGTSMNAVKEHLQASDFLYGSLYANPNKLDELDVHGVELQTPYLLEWALFNSGYMTRSYIDFDGILCPNVPYEIAIDEDKYVEYISNVKPIYDRLPRLYQCSGIVTARLEKYRDITEAWLKKYNVNYDKLIMFPTERQEERDKDHINEVSKFKAKHYAESNNFVFVESELHEARSIAKLSNKFVVCPDVEEIFHA